jgi:sugar/nucleoside kinase (ribokinase family)
MKKYLVSGIGNAIVDIIILVSEEFLVRQQLVKNSMTLIDKAMADKLSALKYEKICSGGSVANSIASLANFEIKTSLIGKVGLDQFGEIFTQELQKNNIDFHCQNKSPFDATAKSFILVTPDGHRTMCTFLGSASDISSEINESIIADSLILYIEGYLWDKSTTIAALKKALNFAQANQTLAAFTLSDSFCVERHRQEFLDLLPNLDILFANEFEIKALLACDQLDLDAVGQLAEANNLTIIVTQSERGAALFYQNQYYQIPTQANDHIVDTTGAGDSFAAGFLYGLVKNYSLEKSAQIGNLFAGKIITKLGARFEPSEVIQLNQLL